MFIFYYLIALIYNETYISDTDSVQSWENKGYDSAY